LLQWASESLLKSAFFVCSWLRAFLVGRFKVTPKVKSVFYFTISYRFVVWRFAFFGCDSHFIPGINVPVVFVVVFGCQGGSILLQLFFGLDTVTAF